ncbi:MAG: GNAT family N-acetyltransferase [Candidatus Hodarchaeales archaeon]
MDFRRAIEDDIESIIEINKSLLKKNLSSYENGFLLGQRDENYVQSKVDRYYVALGENNQLLGYVEIDYQIGKEDFAKGEWESQEVKSEVLEAIENGKFVYIIQIAVKEQRKGIGKFLINSLHDHFRNRILISFVAYKPLFNEVSLNFHFTAGFERAGLFIMEGKFGIERYERICLVRKDH